MFKIIYINKVFFQYLTIYNKNNNMGCACNKNKSSAKRTGSSTTIKRTVIKPSSSALRRTLSKKTLRKFYD